VLRVLLANDTGRSKNPGCQSVRRAVDILLGEAGAELVDSFPLSYWLEPFKAIAPQTRGLRVDARHFPTAPESAPDLDLDEWISIRKMLMQQDSGFRRRLAAVDLLIVNGEGSIHHNLPRALSLLAMIDAAEEFGVPTMLVNATIQAMDRPLLQRVLPKLQFCHVRESASSKAIAPIITAHCAPDIAVRAIDTLKSRKAPLHRQGCLVSAGVLAKAPIIEELLRTAATAGLSPTYFSIGDGRETETASAVCNKLGVEHVQACNFSLDTIPGLLEQFELAICGRHHINLFLMKAGVPIVPLPSNTWKVEATLTDLSYPVPLVRTLDDLSAAIAQVRDQLEATSEAGRASFTQAVSRLNGYAARLAVEGYPRRLVKKMESQS
jgi:hypothetical protein